MKPVKFLIAFLLIIATALFAESAAPAQPNPAAEKPPTVSATQPTETQNAVQPDWQAMAGALRLQRDQVTQSAQDAQVQSQLQLLQLQHLVQEKDVRIKELSDKLAALEKKPAEAKK